ncbi:MAG TPA: hypothetical protein VGE02_14550 [Gemmatimonadales bacterium]
MRLLATGALAAAMMLLTAGCSGGRPTTDPVAGVTPAASADSSAWTVALDSVQALVAADRHAAADTLLERFIMRHSSTPAAAEAKFWRALVALDPGNGSAEPRDALVAIDAYLAGGVGQPRYEEALVLRRTAGALEGARSVPIQTLTVTTLPADSLVRLRAAQDTIRQLRADLERTQAELDRIRRRIRP